MRSMPAASHTPIVVPADSARLSVCVHVYSTSIAPVAVLLCSCTSQTHIGCSATESTWTRGPLQSCHTPVERERFSPKFRRYGRGKTKRHSNACLHRVRDRASSLCEGVTTLVSFPHIRRHMISVFLPWTLIHKPAQRPVF